MANHSALKYWKSAEEHYLLIKRSALNYPKRDLELLLMYRKLEKYCKFFRKSVLSFYKKLKLIIKDLVSIDKPPAVNQKLQNYCKVFKNIVISFYETLIIIEQDLKSVVDLSLIHQKIKKYYNYFVQILKLYVRHTWWTLWKIEKTK